jgi:tRNA-2-methylthio-N6-dimethylallyladenosine synthase
LLAQRGVGEVTLLGQNVNSYGRDLTKRRPLFAQLLRAVGAVEGIGRVRFTSPHPKDLRPETIEAMATTPAVCEQLHLPLQSGSDAVLRAMRRGYSAARYLERLAAARAAIDDLAVTTDIIVGFPGETEADFEETLKLLDEVQYDSLFSFKYSPRPNTAALAMEDKIPEEEKTRRLTILNEKQRAIQIRRNTELIGSVEEVLVEGRHEALGQWIGRTSQNRTLNFTHADAGGASLVGQYMYARVTRSGPNSLAGEAFRSASGQYILIESV